MIKEECEVPRFPLSPRKICRSKSVKRALLTMTPANQLTNQLLWLIEPAQLTCDSRASSATDARPPTEIVFLSNVCFVAPENKAVFKLSLR